MAKLIKCKACGADIAKNAKTCPNCGAKNKKGNPILGVLLLLVAVAIFAGVFGSGGDEPEKVGDVSSSGASSSVKEEKKTFGVGDKVELNDVVVTLVDVTESEGKEFFEPTEGNVFVLFEFNIENNTSSDIAVSSLMSFQAYFDDYAANVDISAMAMSEKTQLDGTIAGGKKMSGVVGYQAPADWKSVEIQFTPDFWSSKDIVFTYNK